jgi:hypothetical protein
MYSIVILDTSNDLIDTLLGNSQSTRILVVSTVLEPNEKFSATNAIITQCTVRDRLNVLHRQTSGVCNEVTSPVRADLML